MLKDKVIETLGQSSLLLPAWIKAALLANDRLKLYLTMLQSAAQHANSPELPIQDWGRDLAQVSLHDSEWLQTLVKSAYFEDQTLIIPQLNQLLNALATDLSIMARPICDSGRECQPELVDQRESWLQKLHAMEDDEGIDRAMIADLTHGNRKAGHSFHILVMDLHKQLNAMASEIATENLNGAHVWQIEDADRALILAFMRGLHRTSPLKFSHPGLDTAATRDGDRLLIQNDIGTNDVHVLVVEVEQRTISLTYSDLHTGRFDFFRQMLEEVGFEWTVLTPVTSKGLNASKPYIVGKARFKAEDDDFLKDSLEALASRIVFVIDWNRARKRLQNFVRKHQAISLLRRAAKEEWGHMAWLLAGGERLVFNAMQTVDSEAFRVGDRLDEVLGDAPATEFLSELMRISSVMLRQKQPVALLADEARMLLARMLRQRTFEFDLVAEHAAYCHALALTLCDALENGNSVDDAQSASRVLQAKTLERRADHLLMDARQRAERQSRWACVVDLLEKSDDVADALEEACFTQSMVFQAPLPGLPAPVKEVISRLADTTLAAIQDQVRAIEIARHVSDLSDPGETELFLQTLWRILRAERICDDLSRQARVTIVRSLHDSPAGFLLASDLVDTIEKASDSMLAVGYALRKLVLNKTGISA
jgi:uncharacterized protein Yka (UPF0111/DUF47 family)